MKRSRLLLLSLMSSLLIISVSLFQWDLVDMITEFLMLPVWLFVYAFFIIITVWALIHLFKIESGSRLLFSSLLLYYGSSFPLLKSTWI